MANPRLTPNKLFKDARVRLFGSREALADAANAHLGAAFILNANDIGKIERGVVTCPRPPRRAALRLVLHANSDAELGFSGKQSPTLPADENVPLEDSAAATASAGRLPVMRRNAISAARDADERIEARTSLESALDPLERLAELTDSTVTDQRLENVDRMLRGFIEEYETAGPHDVIPRVRRQLSWTNAALSGYERPRHIESLYRQSARLTGMLAYMAVNLRRFALARAYCVESFGLAEFIGDMDLQAWVRGTESFCAYYEGDFKRAYELAVDGEKYARQGPQSIRLIINGKARALAKLGDTHETRRAIDKAFAIATSHGIKRGMSPCLSFDAYSDARTMANAVTAYSSLGLPVEVNELLVELAPTVDASDSVWSRSLVRLDRAKVLLAAAAPEPEEATILAAQALDISAERPIASVLIRAREILAGAEPWRDLDTVRQLGETLKECEAR
ncbi:hypothetical protein GCM10010172_30850 [Paractinoplanes ferrugineus]|uniref:Uncharacterized protein n=2 Tax=Paractinoplanes ferrugineus TaxID=113564 RepID=A0A919MFW9_9ACTN|nr:hypothetical protein Afe05nite_60630 [Actinoplanes ferrugineus]